MSTNIEYSSIRASIRGRFLPFYSSLYDGNRVSQTINGVTTYFIGGIYEVTGSTVTKYYFAGSQRVAMRKGTALYYLLSDHLGRQVLLQTQMEPWFRNCAIKPGAKYAMLLGYSRPSTSIPASILTVTLTCSGTAPGTTTPNSDVSFSQIPLYRLHHKELKLGTDMHTSTTIRYDILIRVDIV